MESRGTIRLIQNGPEQDTLQLQGWEVPQLSFIRGARSLSKESLQKNLQAVNISQAGMESESSRSLENLHESFCLDEYDNILWGM